MLEADAAFVAVEDCVLEGVDALVLVELAAEPAPLRWAGEVAQDALGLDQAPVVLQRGREGGPALPGVESCDEQARGDGPRVQRSGEAQHLVPLFADQREADAVAKQPAGRAVVNGPAAPETSVGQPGEARREAQAEEVKQREDEVAVAGGVGAVDADRELAAVIEDPSRTYVASRTVVRITRVAKWVCWSETNV